jgi:hypothetical protein
MTQPTTFISTLREREALAVRDRDTMGPFETYVFEPKRCVRCMQRVFVYATSADGQRTYCRCIKFAR